MPTPCPPLRIREVGDRVRLSVDGLSQADGGSLQEAADALLCRLRVLALAYRSHGFGSTRHDAPTGFDGARFLHELGEVAARGGDLRGPVFGVS